jgi:hypothetical protein
VGLQQCTAISAKTDAPVFRIKPIAQPQFRSAVENWGNVIPAYAWRIFVSVLYPRSPVGVPQADLLKQRQLIAQVEVRSSLTFNIKFRRQLIRTVFIPFLLKLFVAVASDCYETCDCSTVFRFRLLL